MNVCMHVRMCRHADMLCARGTTCFVTAAKGTVAVCIQFATVASAHSPEPSTTVKCLTVLATCVGGKTCQA